MEWKYSQSLQTIPKESKPKDTVYSSGYFQMFSSLVSSFLKDELFPLSRLRRGFLVQPYSLVSWTSNNYPLIGLKTARQSAILRVNVSSLWLNLWFTVCSHSVVHRDLIRIHWKEKERWNQKYITLA